jgi:hypothetical protein
VIFESTSFNTALSAAPSHSTVSEDAGIEPRTGLTSELSVRRFNYWAIKAHPQTDNIKGPHLCFKKCVCVISDGYSVRKKFLNRKP